MQVEDLAGQEGEAALVDLGVGREPVGVQHQVPDHRRRLDAHPVPAGLRCRLCGEGHRGVGEVSVLGEEPQTTLLARGGDQHLRRRVGRRDQRGGQPVLEHAVRGDHDRCHQRVEERAVEAVPLHRERGLPRLVGLVHHGGDEAGLAGLEGDQPVGEGAPEGVPERLAALRPVHRSPGDDRPAVVELPHDRPGHVRPAGPPVLHAELDGPRLVHLGEVVPVVGAEALAEVVGQAAQQVLLAELGLLVRHDAGGLRRQGLVRDRLAESRPGGRRLPAELGDERRGVVAVAGVVPAVPDVPDVDAAVVWVVRRQLGRAGPRGAGPVVAGRVHLGHDAR
ncbi:MAG: hypothetical protein ACTHQ3_05420 [Motilibacteraceae bacterium]